MHRRNYDVIVIGSGIAGSALLFTLACHTDIKHPALIEKHDRLAAVNASAWVNSQTLHCSDIETNYTRGKAAEVETLHSGMPNPRHVAG